MTIEDASAGFRNQGQFIAALNVSRNRGIPFADLQQAMTVDGLSLGQAARTLLTPVPVAPPTTDTGTAGTGTTGTGTTGTGTTGTDAGTGTTGTNTGGTGSTSGTDTTGTTTGTNTAPATN
jgi:hypothetical protein